MAINEAARVTVLMKAAANRALKTFVQNSFRELIEATPVRSGWAQSNWLVAVGDVPDNPVGSPGSLDLGPQQQSLRTIRKYKPEQGELVIYNNVPYIDRLNNGLSPQAPAGFVDEILDRVAKEVDRSILR